MRPVQKPEVLVQLQQQKVSANLVTLWPEINSSQQKQANGTLQSPYQHPGTGNQDESRQQGDLQDHHVGRDPASNVAGEEETVRGSGSVRIVPLESSFQEVASTFVSYPFHLQNSHSAPTARSLHWSPEAFLVAVPKHRGVCWRRKPLGSPGKDVDGEDTCIGLAAVGQLCVDAQSEGHSSPLGRLVVPQHCL